MAVYRSTAPLQGPVTLGGNAAYPAVGAQGNYAVVLKAADVGRTLAEPRQQEPPHKDAAGRKQGAEKKVGGEEESGLEGMVEGCGGKEGAVGCLEAMHSCMAPYKMGDLSSCHCFYGGKGRGADAHQGWPAKEWCSDQCRLAVYNVYNSKVVAATGFRMGCGLGEEE
eukprot:1729890-Rhodomonas_salina.1